MTDEEMAEDWIKDHSGLIGSYKFVKYDFDSLKQAYLAGLKAGRPAWHDLRKDLNDLPRNKRNVWCDYGDGYGKGFYDKNDGGWWIEGYCSMIDAWCVLPTFDKE